MCTRSQATALPRRHALLVAGIVASTFLIAIILLLGLAPTAQASSAAAARPNSATDQVATVINANIVTNTTWTKTGSPYLVNADVTVQAGVTLTVEPGVEVQFDQANGLTVYGRLVAVGTSSEPITFTGTSQVAGWWDDLKIQGTSGSPNTGSRLSYVTVEYGGRSYGNLYLQHAHVSIDHATIWESGSDGIYAWTGGVADISDSTFANNTGYAVRFTDGSVDPVLARLSGTGNGTNGVALGGGVLMGVHVWENMGLPYVVVGDQRVESGASLTVEPGVEIRFGEAYGLTVDGTLTAVGSATEPITFTGTFTQAGWWDDLKIRGTSGSPNLGSRLSHVTLEYGGRSYGNLYLEHAQVPIDHATIRKSGSAGIYAWTGGVADISDSTFANNMGYAVHFTDGSVNPVLARLSGIFNGTNGVALGGGVLMGSHVWENMGLPYVVIGDQRVESGASLTVEPGVEVQFGQADGLTVDGTLTAVGSATEPITFTGTSQVVGWWDDLKIRGTSSAPNSGSRLSYVTMEFGGRSYGNLYLEHAHVPIDHSIFRASGSDGIYAWTGGVADISDSTFANNMDYAVHFTDGSVNPVLARLKATGNGKGNVVALGGGVLTGSHVWENTGVSYLVVGDERVESGASLTVEPGVEVQFGQADGLTVDGTLTAVGTATAPITFTGTMTQAGWWDDLKIRGTSSAVNVGTELSYVTIEYGGRSYGSLYLEHAQVHVSHSIIRYSGSDGVYAWTGGGNSVVEASQIVGNTGYGVNNRDSNILRAENNWWGSNTGPIADTGCNPGGAGDKVSENVLFKPFLRSPTDDPGPVAPGDARLLSIEPQSWFVPADGVTRAWVTITLRDGSGNPLPGRRVRLNSTLGDVTDGDLTDVQGRSFAYVTSNTPGDATFTAVLDAEACESALPASTTVTFSPFTAGSDLLPDAAAPYAYGGLEYTPAPIVRGVTTTLSVNLTNPNAFPILVNGTFGFAQSGIGLPFGPLGDVQNVEIPANGSKILSVQWVPLVSGHYCARFDYNWTPAGASSAVQGAGGLRAQSNLSVYPGSLGSAGGKESLEKADKAFGLVSKAPGAKQLAIQKHLIGRWWQWVKESASEISQALGGDPPRQDYKTIAMPEWPQVPPVQPGPDVSQQRADALNAVTDALLDVVAYGRAATVSLDRYGGAAAANDLEWSSQQAAALIYYKQKTGQAMLTAADALDAFLHVLWMEGETEFVVTASDIQAYQDRLRTQGFTSQEIQDAKLIGLSDEEIEAFRQEILAADPADLAGDIIQMMADEAQALRNAGNILATEQNFPSAGTVSTASGSTAAGNNLARVYTARASVQVGNPASTTDTLELRVRRINVPADWAVAVTPVTATLAPGEVITATVSVIPGGPVVQGTTPRVAVEGYDGSGNLISGVVVDVLVPRAAYFDGKLRIYLPTVQK